MKVYVRTNQLESKPATELEDRIKMMVKMSEMDGQDLVNAIRAEWTRALTLPHPAFQRHLISGNASARKDENVKVDGKKAVSPIVASKRPKAAKAA
jgi:hypothetical protein